MPPLPVPAPAAPTIAATATGERLAWLDGWRGVSILLVLVGHFTVAHRAAHLGVEMFFVLSGRLMAGVLIEQRQPIGTFVWRRVARVWPALWAYVALVAAGLLVSQAVGDQRHALVGALAAVSFTANYVAAAVDIPYFDHGWSLAVEEHCYLVLAGVAVLVARRRGAAIVATLVLALLAMASGAIQAAMPGRNVYYVYLQSDVRAASVLLPFALSLAATTLPGGAVLRRLPYLGPLALVAGVWWGTMDPGWLRFGPGTLALAVAVVAIDTAPAGWRRALASRPLLWLGAVSFSLYLWQQPFMMLRRAGAPSLPCAAAAVLLGMWSYYRVERPARRRLAATSPAAVLRRWAAALVSARERPVTG